jgi:guanylate kinase
VRMKGGKPIIFFGLSGSGKIHIVRHLYNAKINWFFSVSATSRPRRGKEKNKEHYYLCRFRSLQIY